MTRFNPDKSNRCPTCVMVMHLCICSELPKIDNKTYVTIMMHFREIKTTSNTGRLSHLSLKNSEIRLRGSPEFPFDTEGLIHKGRQNMVLQLCDEAYELNPDFLAKFPGPHHLIVPDGNWRQASKMHKREAVLKDLPKVRLPLSTPSRYRLRKEHKLGGLATHEAIGRALGILEGTRVQTEMERIFDIMVERTITLRPTMTI